MAKQIISFLKLNFKATFKKTYYYKMHSLLDLMLIVFQNVLRFVKRILGGTFNAFYFHLDLIKDCSSFEELSKISGIYIYRVSLLCHVPYRAQQ